MTKEEAIECIRGFMGQLTEGCREAIIIAIPELRESKDERIRKEIIHYILYKANGVSEEQEHEWVAYLGKQKEQKDIFSQSHWRPTKKQMKVLWDAYKGGKEQEPLRELIEQLKKLM